MLPIRAVAKGRAKASRFGIFYTPKKTRDAEKQLRDELIKSKAPLLTGALAMGIAFTFVRPKSAKGRVYPCVRPDLDNLGKLVLDACNGILYADDAQVCQLSKIKRYGEVDSVEITVFEI